MISPASPYEAVAKGHTTLGLIPNTVASLPVYIVDIVPNQCAHERDLSFSVCLDCVFGRSRHFTGITSSIPEDESAVIILQSALGRFGSFFSFQDKRVIPYGFHVLLRL